MAPITVHVAVVHTVRSIRLVTAVKSRAALADSTEGGRRRRYVNFLVGSGSTRSPSRRTAGADMIHTAAGWTEH
jgi:hypothetical protein